MIEKKIKDSFDQATLSEKEKRNLYDRIVSEAYSSQNVTYLERKKAMKKLVIGAACLAAACIVPAGTYAAYKWMSPKQVATAIEDEKLAKRFGKQENEVQVKESGEFRVAFLGTVSGKQIGASIEADGEIKDDRTYLAVAIERKDGLSMKMTDSIYISPFVQHLKPWEYNIQTMNGSFVSVVEDGVLYRMVECDNLEMFANKNVYLAVQDGSSYKKEAYAYNEDGTIQPKKDYKGMNLLFSVSLDASKADPEAVSQWRKEFEANKNGDSAENMSDVATGEDINADKDSQMIKSSKATYELIDANRFSAVSDESYYGLFAQIKGENIESITYTLEKGVFYKKTEATDAEIEDYDTNKYAASMTKELISGKRGKDGNDQVMGDQTKRNWLLSKAGNSYTVAYDKQNTAGNFYAIKVTAKESNEDAGREEIVKQLADALKDEVVHVTVTFKDGQKESKDIIFMNNDTARISKVITVKWK